MIWSRPSNCRWPIRCRKPLKAYAVIFAQLVVAGFLLSLSLCVDLGLVNIAIIRAGLTRGMRAALYLGLGSCLGDMIYAVSSMWLVSLLLTHRWVRLLLWIGGSAVLVWLAVKMLRETWHPKTLSLAGTEPAAVRPLKEFGRGAMLALSSPTAILWFAAVGGSVIAAHASDTAALLPFLGGFLAAGLLWTVLIAALTGYAHRRLSSGFIRLLALTSALLFCYFAVVVFMNGYREFL
jgi:L-lysine exporter family protein LysE/ArgO